MAVALSDIDVASVQPRAKAIAQPKRKARIVVSLDSPPSSSTSSSSDYPDLEAVVAAMKRELDRTVSHTQGMQLQIDTLNVEVSHLKRRRL